ncbi:redoxin domain-containing protein [Ornithinibacillus sp. 4-3]|uniref:Redoxin domain-containing protein n=1 Tax=Ornithinibacillus sp. 4-3 TaxID=3231488 RepID=A0AB39HML2_9BACI
MKKALLIVLLVGMLGWTIYEFVLSENDTSRDEVMLDENTEEEEPEILEEETSGVPGKSEENEDVLQESEEQEESVVGLNVGDMAPDFHLTTLDGEEVALSDYRGSRVWINFWATWCPPCRAEMPDMEEFYKQNDVEILAINLTETEPSTNQVQRFVDEYGLTFPILLDEVIEVATAYKIQPIPTSFMLDSEGVIQFKSFGPLTYEQMEEVFADIE